MANSGIYNSNQRPDSAIISGFHLPVDAEGGTDLRQVKPGTVIEVETRNNTYTLIPQPSGETMIWGHPEYCPEPTLISGLGGAYANGLFREAYLSPGMRLSFPMAGRRVSTSSIIAIRPTQRN
jgi:hypothetical protein